MASIRFLDMKTTSLWSPFAGAALAAWALFQHPMLARTGIRNDVVMSLKEDITDYLGYGFAAFGLFWVVLHPWLRTRQIARRRWPRLRQMVRELIFSLSSQVIMTCVALYIMFGNDSVMSNMQISPGLLGWLWAPVLTFLLFAAEDTSFYWMHRIIHHPKLFRHIHRVHHESFDPTPFTAYSFHPFEAILQALSGLSTVFVLVLLPWHPASLAVYAVGQIAFNIIGHLGYEIYPANWNRIPGLRWKTPGLHHYLHHQMVKGNYALYFRWWDTWCGTEFADFEERYDRIFRPISSDLANASTLSPSNPAIPA
jgi:Delta7-sterol 5-desaturase